MKGSRADGTNPRALGISRRQLGVSPRGLKGIERARKRGGHVLDPHDRIIPYWLRFEILKRDGFRCRYCGAGRFHQVALQVDHIHPVSKGGLTVPDNLVTACEPCNKGKCAELLTDRHL